MGSISRQEWEAYKAQQRAARNSQVYRLRDPRDGSVRYVGLTQRTLLQRLQEHIRGAQASRGMRAWIQELQSAGLVPLIEMIEANLTPAEAERQETYWINHYLRQGAKLFNRSKTPAPARCLS